MSTIKKIKVEFCFDLLYYFVIYQSYYLNIINKNTNHRAI